jgi:hypothetical protein
LLFAVMLFVLVIECASACSRNSSNSRALTATCKCANRRTASRTHTDSSDRSVMAVPYIAAMRR